MGISNTGFTSVWLALYIFKFAKFLVTHLGLAIGDVFRLHCAHWLYHGCRRDYLKVPHRIDKDQLIGPWHLWASQLTCMAAILHGIHAIAATCVIVLQENIIEWIIFRQIYKWTKSKSARFCQTEQRPGFALMQKSMFFLSIFQGGSYFLKAVGYQDPKARAKHSPFAKSPDLAIIGERISGLTKILAKDFQLLGKINK